MTNIPEDKRLCKELLDDSKEAVKQLYALYTNYSAVTQAGKDDHNNKLRELIDQISRMRMHYLYVEHYVQNVVDTIALHGNADPTLLNSLRPTKELLFAHAKAAAEVYQQFLHAHDQFKAAHDAIATQDKNDLVANKTKQILTLKDVQKGITDAKEVPYAVLEAAYRYRRFDFVWKDEQKNTHTTRFQIQAMHPDKTIDLAIVYQGTTPQGTDVDLHTARFFSKLRVTDSFTDKIARLTLEKDITRHMQYLREWSIGKILQYKGQAGVRPRQEAELTQAGWLALHTGVLTTEEIGIYITENRTSPRYTHYQEMLENVKKAVKKAHKQAGGAATSPVTYEHTQIPTIIADFLEHLRTSPLAAHEQYELVHGPAGLQVSIAEILQSISMFSDKPAWAKRMEILFTNTSTTNP